MTQSDAYLIQVKCIALKTRFGGFFIAKLRCLPELPEMIPKRNLQISAL